MPEPTYYAKKLVEELRKKGVKAKLEHHDGKKSVDIFIEKANLEIEVDGSHHNLDPEQALRDLFRTKYSMVGGKKTIRIPNTLVYKYPLKTAEIVRDIVNGLKEEPKHQIGKKKTVEQTLTKKDKKDLEEMIERVLDKKLKEPEKDEPEEFDWSKLSPEEKKKRIKAVFYISIGFIILIITRSLFNINLGDYLGTTGFAGPPPEENTLKEDDRVLENDIVIENNTDSKVQQKLNITRIWDGKHYIGTTRDFEIEITNLIKEKIDFTLSYSSEGRFHIINYTIDPYGIIVHKGKYDQSQPFFKSNTVEIEYR